jgi:hypothetical protein
VGAAVAAAVVGAAVGAAVVQPAKTARIIIAARINGNTLFFIWVSSYLFFKGIRLLGT